MPNRKSQKRMYIIIALILLMTALIYASSVSSEKTDDNTESETDISISEKSDNEPRTVSLEIFTPLYNEGTSFGDFEVMEFGTYEQDCNTENGTETISWIVLGKTEDSLLLLSLNGLEAKPYKLNENYTTWANSTLRSWLNVDFYNTAFSDEEKEKILSVSLSPGENPYSDASAGSETEDRVFLLSVSEVLTYLPSKELRKCFPTDHELESGGFTIGMYETVWWWLRSPGANNQYACDILFEGNLHRAGHAVSYADNAVRPVICIKTE